MNPAIITDGASGMVTWTTAVNLTTFTLEAWVKPDAASTTNASIILTTDAHGQQITLTNQVRIAAQGVFEAYVWDGQPKVVDGTTHVVAGTRYHVVVTATNGGQMHLYVNGVEEGTPVNIATLQTGGTKMLIGSNSGAGMNFFKGTIDDTAIYANALTAAQVRAHYNAGLSCATPTPTPCGGCGC